MTIAGFVEGTGADGTTTLVLDSHIKGPPNTEVTIRWYVNTGAGSELKEEETATLDATGNLPVEAQTMTSSFVAPAGSKDFIVLDDGAGGDEAVSQGGIWKEGGSVVRTPFEVPAQSRSGLVVLAILLLATAVFVILRRRGALMPTSE